MHTILKLNEKLGTVEMAVMGCSILVITAMLITNVVSRFLGNNIPFAEEVCQWFVISNTFIGVSHNARKGKHIVMSAIYDNIKPRAQKVFILISSCFSSLALIYLTVLGVQYVESVKMMTRVSPALRVPMWIPYLMVPVGFALAALQYAIIFYQNLKDPSRPFTLVQSLDPNKNSNVIEIDGVELTALNLGVDDPPQDEERGDNH